MPARDKEDYDMMLVDLEVFEAWDHCRDVCARVDDKKDDDG